IENLDFAFLRLYDQIPILSVGERLVVSVIHSAKGAAMARKGRLHLTDASRTVTAERAARLHRLLTLLATGPQKREMLRRQMRMDVRSFYRDLELLRSSGIAVLLHDRHYVMEMAPKAACNLLPFPDPHFTLGEAVELAKGRTPAHRKLRSLIDQILAAK